jgi:ornithine decarboxylase
MLKVGSVLLQTPIVHALNQGVRKYVVATPLRLDPRQHNKLIQFGHSVSELYDIKNNQNGILNINLKYVDNQLVRWLKTMAPIIPFYAVKSLPDKRVIKRLTHFDCASKDEIATIIEEGIAPENIIYANTTKTVPYIKYAINNKIDIMTADSLSECEKIINIDKNIKIVLRLAVNDSGAKTSFSNKFGITDMEEFAIIVDYINSVGGVLHGFSFHVGSGQNNCLLYKQALEKIDIAIDHIKWKVPKLYNGISLIDIGGGFSHNTNLTKIKRIIDPHIKKYGHYKWIAEPGRYFSENAGILVCPIIGKKKLNGMTCYVVDDNIYQTFSNTIHDNYKVEFNNCELDEEGIIFGNSCDGRDILYSGKLPTNIDIGTVIIFLHTGAYTCASSCNFNGLEKPIIMYLE